MNNLRVRSRAENFRRALRFTARSFAEIQESAESTVSFRILSP
jgi:hypothetical protein